MTIRHIVVVVPARNEAQSIRGCLTSIDRARRRLPTKVTSSVVVVADCCDDGTVDLARAVSDVARGDAVIVTRAGSAGAARRLGAHHGLRQRENPISDIWIANTDADSVVPPDWLTLQLAAGNEGLIGIAGSVGLDPTTVVDALLDESFRRSYLVFGDGTHPHVHAANLGFRADAYRAVGGWSTQPSGEDHDLWNRLKLYGPVSSRTALTVATSARLQGRAPEGFAADLATLADVIQTVA